MIVQAAAHHYIVVQIGHCEWQSCEHIVPDCLEDTQR